MHRGDHSISVLKKISKDRTQKKNCICNYLMPLKSIQVVLLKMSCLLDEMQQAGSSSWF